VARYWDLEVRFHSQTCASPLKVVRIAKKGRAMSFFRNDKSVPSDSYKSASDYCSAIRDGLREKADHNKHESQIAFFGAISLTLVTPLFVTLADGWLLGKLVPAVLSVLSAAATAWLQLRKPQRLWAIYRRGQRELEREKASYDFRLDVYADDGERDKLLAKKVTDIAFRVHEQWEGLVPEPDALLAKTPAVPILEAGNPDGR
jgi:hypothetical protein